MEREDVSEDRTFLQKEPCPACGSKDNLARWSDGSAWCFGCERYERPSDEYAEAAPTQSRKKTVMAEDLLPKGKHLPIGPRKISVETCRKFDYTVSKMSGKRCHVANLRDQSGTVVAQHVRTAGKDFPWIGNKKDAVLFGQHAMRDGASKVIITEGEIDAMSVWEVISNGRNGWAVVSVKGGADGARNDLAEQLSWLEKSPEIILMFDMDEKGQEAAAKCARLFKPGKCKIASLPLKDASEMLQEERGPEILDAIFQAKEWRPEGIKRISDVRDEVLSDLPMGLPYWHEGLTDATLGRRFGELVAFGAGTGVGKSDNLAQQVAFDLSVLDLPVGTIFLEQQPRESVRRIAGKHYGKMFHVPSDKLAEEAQWEARDLEAAVDQIDEAPLFMYDHFGTADYDRVEDFIRFLAHRHGVRIFYLDHLTALAAQEDDERKALERIMARLGGLVKELDIWIGLVSHLATPDGKPHEEGGRVMIRHFKGSRAIGYWCHFMIGLERDQQAEDPRERTITTYRVLKDRVTGLSTGKTFPVGFDSITGRLIELDPSELEDEPFPDDEDDGDEDPKF